MTLGGPGPIIGRATIDAVDQHNRAAAEASDARAARAELDDADLQEVERERYYGEAPSEPPAGPAATLRKLIGRLFGRAG